MEVIRQLKVGHDTAATTTLTAMIVHAAESMRAETARKTQRMTTRCCGAIRPQALRTPEDSIRDTVRSLAGRRLALDEESMELVSMIEQLVMKQAPRLLSEVDIDMDTVDETLIVAGSNPKRIHSEPAFAVLPGMSPVPED